jgi:hypothetical protein
MWYERRKKGDPLSRYLVGLISSKEVVLRRAVDHRPFLEIGSILGEANKYADVWGSEFIYQNERVSGVPRRVHALRWPLARNLLLRQGRLTRSVWRSLLGATELFQSRGGDALSGRHPFALYRRGNSLVESTRA